ncbi:MAG TPA: peptidylprolyl isomerase [Ferruginibacter sp.]|nr:peptidylprolyl isomerase [Ferruginibacter sp.]HRO17940.1 peptidylprolyl isomerase [Ferruginibacter sp.]HRQ20017.1 peptidylprolyl isomerase [Ferruginibacter sp.]
MKQSFLTLCIILAATMLYAQPYKVVADKIIAVVGNKVILQSDVDNTILDMQRQGVPVPENAECLVLEQSMGMKALVLQAEKDSIPVSEEEVETSIENQIRGFINAYGSKDELERVAGRSVYQIKEDFKESFRERKLAESMRNKIVDGIRITPQEVKAYFDKIPIDSLPLYEAELEIGQIIIFPKASKDVEEYAIEQLSDIRKQAEAGRDFGVLANMHTEDGGSKDRGGMYEINRTQRDLDPVWLSKAFTLKEGQVSQPFKTRFGYHIIKLESRMGDEAVVRHILKIPKVTQVEIKAGMEKMDSVRSMLIAGTIDFGTAVARYSEDDMHKFTAGMLMGRNGSFLTIDELDKSMIPVIATLRPGEFSQPVEYTDERGRRGVRIVYLKSKSEPHVENLKDDYSKIAQRALEIKKDEALDKWFSEKVKTYHIMVDKQYHNCEVLQKWLPHETAKQ